MDWETAVCQIVNAVVMHVTVIFMYAFSLWMYVPNSAGLLWHANFCMLITVRGRRFCIIPKIETFSHALEI